MQAVRIVIGSDHAGFRLKETLKEHLRGRGLEVEDLGAPSEESVDYPPIGRAVAARVAEDAARRGILICGTGIGMSIAANRVPGARAALCHRVEFARLTREHNDANILVLPGRFLEEDEARAILDAFLETPFAGGRHERRVRDLDAGR